MKPEFLIATLWVAVMVFLIVVGCVTMFLYVTQS